MEHSPTVKSPPSAAPGQSEADSDGLLEIGIDFSFDGTQIFEIAGQGGMGER